MGGKELLTAIIRDSVAYVRATLAKVQRKSEIPYARSPIQESPAEIQPPTQWKVIGRSVATPTARVVAQMCLSASLFSLRFHSRHENLGTRYKNVFFICFFFFFFFFFFCFL